MSKRYRKRNKQKWPYIWDEDRELDDEIPQEKPKVTEIYFIDPGDAEREKAQLEMLDEKTIIH